jgi:DNA repair protein RecN (Recombination protein N)
LNSDEQRRLLDAFGKNQPLVERVNTCYRHWQHTHKERESLIKASADQGKREELLRYQLNELQQLDLVNFSYAALSEEHGKQANLEQILTAGQTQVDSLYEQDQSVCSLLSDSIRVLTDLARFTPELAEICTLLSEAQIQTEESALQLRRFLDAQEANPLRLEALEKEIAIIQDLSRKHHVLPDELPTLTAQLETELDGITHSGERIEALTLSVQQLQTDYGQLAEQLSQQRLASGLTLQRHISAMIKELGMPQGEFLVALSSLDSDTPKLNGWDKIEFLVSANPGLPPKPLVKVASGGELSRISLAIQVTTSNDKTTPTMIFDEVDSGIGGSIAELVGQKLRALSHHRQVLCVTHLPQVAAQAHNHLYVEKNHQTDITSSNVRLLTPEERVAEMARLLGGVNITANTLAHAREMLHQSITDQPSAQTTGT